jgi:hypothetical protein
LLRLCLVDLIVAGVVLLTLPVMLRAVTSEWSRLDGWTRAGRPVGIDRFRGWHNRAKCCPFIVE